MLVGAEADADAANRRATDAQVLEDAERLIDSPPPPPEPEVIYVEGAGGSNYGFRKSSGSLAMFAARGPTFPFTVLQRQQPPGRPHGRFCYWGAIMDISTALSAIERKASEATRGQAGNGEVKTSAEDLAALLRRASEAPTREIDKLIDQLQRLRTQLLNAGNRIQRGIAEYTELSQQTMQLTTIISDSVKKLPDGTYR